MSGIPLVFLTLTIKTEDVMGEGKGNLNDV
jgi:hypothetical protein